MATVTMKKDRLLFEAGSQVSELYLILAGSFQVFFPGGEYTLTKGEVIGICELSSGIHRTGCRALENGTLLVCPVSDIASLEKLFTASSDYAPVFIRSAVRQSHTLLKLFDQSLSTDNAYLSNLEPAVSAELIEAAADGCSSLFAVLKPADTEKEEIVSGLSDLPDTEPAEEAYEEEPVPFKMPEVLRGSLKCILDYSRLEEAFCHEFTELISNYKQVPDKSDTNDGLRKLRAELTTHFYTLYQNVFFRSLTDASLPLPVRMFLCFGFVDEELAGFDNAAGLSELSGHLAARLAPNIYTFYDWLRAIYNGEKEPSRNEFDEDYTDYLRAQKTGGRITAEEEAALLSDSKKRVEYELSNMFPSVNKMTYGRISTFCPVFSSHNVLKNPHASFVSVKKLTACLDRLLSLDYTAFYREYLFSDPAAGIPRESFHCEVLPDFILMPNMGTHCVMWQEIEGHRRNTPARMMLPVFYMDELYPGLLHLAGEYRWEMCKRIQGARWNDISEVSLTSEYFDYIQFYRKNHELSAEAKERIKASLQKARGSFKEMFARDYMTYLLYEASGSPRLSKTARNILSRYCPFTAATRETLLANPLYTEALEHYAVMTGQRLHRLGLLEKKLLNSGKPVPPALLAERRFWEG